MNQKTDVRRIAFLGLMTALVFAGNWARIMLPVPVGGIPSFTLANILCVLSGLLFGPAGGIASGLGSALYDLTNPAWAAESWITLLTKGAMGLTAGAAAALGRGARRERPASYRRCLAAAAALLALIPTSLFNGGLAIAAAPPLAIAIRAALERSGLTLRRA